MNLQGKGIQVSIVPWWSCFPEPVAMSMCGTPPSWTLVNLNFGQLDALDFPSD